MSMVGINWYVEQLEKFVGVALFLLVVFAVVFVTLSVLSITLHLMFDREYRASAKRCLRLIKRYTKSFMRKQLLALRTFFF